MTEPTALSLQPAPRARKLAETVAEGILAEIRARQLRPGTYIWRRSTREMLMNVVLKRDESGALARRGAAVEQTPVHHPEPNIEPDRDHSQHRESRPHSPPKADAPLGAGPPEREMQAYDGEDDPEWHEVGEVSLGDVCVGESGDRSDDRSQNGSPERRKRRERQLVPSARSADSHKSDEAER